MPANLKAFPHLLRELQVALPAVQGLDDELAEPDEPEAGVMPVPLLGTVIAAHLPIA